MITPSTAGLDRGVIDVRDDVAEAVRSGAFEAVGIGLYAIDRAGLVRALNPKAAVLLGWTAEQCEGLSAHETFHLIGDSPGVCPVLAVARSGEPAESDTDLFRRIDGSLQPVWWAATPIFRAGEGGREVIGALVAFADRTAIQAATVADAANHAQVRSDLGAARQAVSDLGWAAEVTQALASASDETEALRRLARMAVPKLCDAIVVSRIDESGHRHPAGIWASAGPGQAGRQVVDLVEGADRHRSPGEAGLAASDVVTVLEDQELAASPLVDPASRALLRQLAAKTVMVVPMAARGHVVAVAEMIRTPERAGFSDSDRLAAMDLGRRLGLTVHNLRLLHMERSAAMVLQEALLPGLVDRPGLRLGWRYRPARDLHRVGGDWYDAFACPDDPAATIVVVGDVAGHDLAAATDMAAMRNLLRGIAVSVPTDPAGLLIAVDAHLEDLGITSTATVLAATVRRAPGDDHGGAWTMRWSNAGHLPPFVVHPGGKAERLEGRPELLLGTGMSAERTVHSAGIPPGSIVVLYTDGLVERPGESLGVGLGRLTAALGAAISRGRAGPQDVVDYILDVLPPSRDDDTAVLAFQIE